MGQKKIPGRKMKSFSAGFLIWKSPQICSNIAKQVVLLWEIPTEYGTNKKEKYSKIVKNIILGGTLWI